MSKELFVCPSCCTVHEDAEILRWKESGVEQSMYACPDTYDDQGEHIEVARVADHEEWGYTRSPAQVRWLESSLAEYYETLGENISRFRPSMKERMRA